MGAGSTVAVASAPAVFGAVVVAVALLAVRPIKVPLPAWRGKRRHDQQQRQQQGQRHRRHRHHVTITYAWPPVLGAAAMLATGALTPAGLRDGIVGDAQLQPYGIVIIFMALAYMSASLDATGLFAAAALWLARASRGRPALMLLFFVCGAGLLTVLTSNDIVIMTLTPILSYVCRATGGDPLPHLAGLFSAANTFSMLLFIGNPTNIIISLAFDLSFSSYTRLMGLPTLAAAAALVATLLARHGRSLPARVALPPSIMRPAAMFVDRPGAALGAANVAACLGLLAAAPALGWPLWAVTLACAGLHAVYNLLAYVVFAGRWCRDDDDAGAGGEAGGGAGAGGDDGAGGGDGDTSSSEQQQQQQQQQQQHGFADLLLPPAHASPQAEAGGQAAATPAASVQLVRAGASLLAPSSSASSLQPPPREPKGAAAAGDGDGGSGSRGGGAAAAAAMRTSPAAAAAAAGAGEGAAAAEARGMGLPPSREQAGGHEPGAVAAAGGLSPPPRPRFWRLVTSLPWATVPFVLGQFVVVQGLVETGWVDRLAGALGASLGSGGVWPAVFGVGWLCVLLGNLLNNQPMTVLLARVLLSPRFLGAGAGVGAAAGAAAAAGRAQLGAALATVVASNTCALFTPLGALAGLMFLSLLRDRAINVSFVAFSRLLAPEGIAATVAALAVLAAELAAGW